MAGFHTPRELELMIVRELGADASNGLLVQIFRDGENWRAGARFSKHNRSRDFEEALSQKVAEIGERLSKGHRLIG